MKKVVFSLFTVMLIMSGCNKSEQFTVTLNLENADNQTVYLCKHADGADVLLDSAIFEGTQAVLKAKFDDPQTTYIIKFDKNDLCGIFPFFTENQNTTIAGDKNDMPHWTAKGCPTLDTLVAYHERSLKEYEDPIMALYAEMSKTFTETGDMSKVTEIDARLQPLIDAYFNNQIEFIKAHSDSYLGHYMLNEIKLELEPAMVKELADGFTNESMYSKEVKEYLKTQKQL